MERRKERDVRRDCRRKWLLKWHPLDRKLYSFLNITNLRCKNGQRRDRAITFVSGLLSVLERGSRKSGGKEERDSTSSAMILI